MKYFVVSDVHGCLFDLEEALDNAGFDKNNENHTLISLGDNFDRGGLSKGVFNFLRRLPRAICLKGNHELLLQEVFRKGYVDYIDSLNGLGETIASFAHISESQVYINNELSVEKAGSYEGLLTWISERPYYFETEHYIFTHGWLPESFYQGKSLSDVTAAEWKEAVWANTPNCISNHRAMVAANAKFKSKTIVVGHWHTWRLRQADCCVASRAPSRKDKDAFGIYTDTENKIIAIDGCTPYSNIVNVLVIED